MDCDTVTVMFDMAKAACRGRGPKAFFPTTWQGRQNSRQAKAICASCKIKQECLDYAIQEGIHHGVWGGLTPYERARYVGKPRKQIF